MEKLFKLRKPLCVTALINSCMAPTNLFVDGDLLYSSEGTTRGDPLAAPMYALAKIPLVKMLYCHLSDVSQVWYGKQIILSQQENLADCVNFGTNWPYKALSLAILPMPPKLG